MKLLSNYKIIIFDFFGVISSEVAPVWFEQQFPQKNSRELMHTYLRPVDAGSVSEENLFTTLGGLANLNPEDVQEEWFSLVKINLEVKSLILSLKPNFKIVLCSNASSVFLRKILKQYELEDLFHTIIISSEIGYAKPDSGFFNKTIEILNCESKDIFFIDDTEKNIIAAKELGIDGITFTDVENIKSFI